MSRFPRAFLVMALTCLGGLGTLVPTQVEAFQDKVPKALPAAPAPPPVMIRKQALLLGAVAAPVQDDSKNGGFTDAITFPTDRKAKANISLAEDFIKEESWGEAARILQSLLDTKEDILIEVRRDNTTRWTSLRSEANRLIGAMPPKGREFYELQFGARAKARLSDAKAKSDPQILAEVAQRYLHTDAGAEATNLLGTYHLDRGRYVMAALCYERLLHHEKADQLSAMTFFKAALAFRRAGDQANADLAWHRLATMSPQGLIVADKKIPLTEVHAELDRLAAADEITSPFDWAMFKGNPSRSAQGNGSAPFLEVKWSQPLIRQPQTEQWVKQAIRHQEERQQPVISGSFPIAATVHTSKETLPLLIYRSHYGIHAVDLRNGQLFWESPSTWSLDKIVEYPDRTEKLMQWVPNYLQGNPSFFYENSTVGTLSSDNSRVFAVDDLVLPPHPHSQPLQSLQWGGQAQFGSLHDAVYHNRLQAFELATGKLLWELGGHSSDKGDFAETYFLGPPLPLGGKLYVLTEKAAELRLVCLDAVKGEVSWSQSLANVRDRLLLDVGRRMRGVNLAYGEGILVCPTNAGAILGVDLLTHSLVWTHLYREDNNNPTVNDRLMRRQMANGWIQMNQNLNTEWKASAPVIQDGKIVFTAPDAASIFCLNLRDGTQLWKQNRADDLYLGGVYNGKVLLVGKRTCRALSLNDGKTLWKVDTGMPSGEGVASDNIYYLPLKFSAQGKEPEVCSIDIDKGIVLAHTKSRKKEVPGNLLFYEGDVLSQTPTQVTAYPQLKVRLAQIDLALQKDPNDPVGLTDRGELKLDKGDMAGALTDLRTALNHTPPAATMSRTRAKLFETFVELFQHHFSDNEKYLDEFKAVCAVSIPAGASAEEKQKLEEEHQRRQANYLCLLGKGREGQGRLVEAFQAYLDFGVLNGNQELVSVNDEPGVKARPDVWSQGRIAAMVAKCSPEQRQPLEDQIAHQWLKVQAAGDTESLRRFVAMFGSLFTIGKEARLRLAERLVDENAFLEAELQLLRLRHQDDDHLSAQAVEALAHLSIRKGLLEDAAYWYRVLGRDYAHVPVRDGKTGADYLSELATDKRLLAYLDEPRELWSGKFKARKISGAFPPQQSFCFEPEGEVLPFFEHQRLVLQNLQNQQQQIKLLDRTTGEERWSQNLPTSLNQMNNQILFYSNNPNSKYPYHVRGHLAVLNVGQMVYAFDPVGQKILWQRGLGGAGVYSPQNSIMPDPRDGGLEVVYSDGFVQRLGQPGPIEASYICLHTRDGLVTLDPLKGTVLWTKTDVPTRAHIFGDGQHIYMFEVRNDRTVGAGRALRAHDGVSVEVPEFAALFQRRLRTIGRHLLLSDITGGKMVLRLYDIQTGKDVWKRAFSAHALVLQTEDPFLTGVVEAKDGKVSIFDLRDFKEIFSTQVDAKDLDKVTGAHLLCDRARFFLTLDRPAERQQNRWGGGPFSNVTNGIRWMQINGTIYAFDRGTGKLRWKEAIQNQILIVDQFKELPVMLFTAMYSDAIRPGLNRGGNQMVRSIRSIDKRTGKWLFNEKSENFQGQAFFSLHADRRAGTIDFTSFNLKIQHYLDDGKGNQEDSQKTTQKSKTPEKSLPLRSVP